MAHSRTFPGPCLGRYTFLLLPISTRICTMTSYTYRCTLLGLYLSNMWLTRTLFLKQDLGGAAPAPVLETVCHNSQSRTVRTFWNLLFSLDGRCVLQVDHKRPRRPEGKAVPIVRVTSAVPQPHQDLHIYRQ